MMTSKHLVVRLPKPHVKQAEIEDCKLKRILVNAGRRAGKTFMVSRIAINKANAGKRVLYIAPITDQTDAFWEMVCEWLAIPIAVGLVKKNEQKRTLLFLKSGGRIQAKTGKLPDHLRGGWGDYIILDEYAYQNPIVWTKVCSPMTADTNATVMFISTPDYRNHFYLMYLKALINKKWKVFTFSTLDNPHLSEEALDSLTEDMTDVDYRQEILAEFIPGEGSVFSVNKDDFYPAEPMAQVLQEHKGHRIVAGLDWGQRNDFTALSIGCATCQKEVYLTRTNKLDYIDQREILKPIIQGFDDLELLAEANSIGVPNIEQLRADGVPTNSFMTTNSSKANIVQQLKLSFNQRAWKWIDDATAWNELEAYEMKVTPSGNRTYNAPQGLNDDYVLARMLMLHQSLTGRFNLA